MLPEDQRQDITEKCLFYPENLAIGKVSVGNDCNMKIYGFGGNAKVSCFMTVPYPLVEGEFEKAKKFAQKRCEEHIEQQMEQYKSFLDNQGIDWKKIEKTK